jgi:hypothetical protein
MNHHNYYMHDTLPDGNCEGSFSQNDLLSMSTEDFIIIKIIIVAYYY